jgi:hypothetical protein
MSLQDQIDRRRFVLKHARQEREELDKRIDRIVREMNDVKRQAHEEGVNVR